MTTPTLYAVAHRTCGHVAGVANDRAMVERVRQQLVVAGQSGWRVRVATDADVEAAVTNARCRTCQILPTVIL